EAATARSPATARPRPARARRTRGASSTSGRTRRCARSSTRTPRRRLGTPTYGQSGTEVAPRPFSFSAPPPGRPVAAAPVAAVSPAVHRADGVVARPAADLRGRAVPGIRDHPLVAGGGDGGAGVARAADRLLADRRCHRRRHGSPAAAASHTAADGHDVRGPAAESRTLPPVTLVPPP